MKLDYIIDTNIFISFDEVLENFLQLWQQTKQQTLINFLRNSPLAEALQEEEMTIEREKSIYSQC